MNVSLDIHNSITGHKIASIPLKGDRSKSELVIHEEEPIFFQISFEEEQDSVVLYVTDVPLHAVLAKVDGERFFYRWYATGRERTRSPFFRNIFGECNLRVALNVESSEVSTLLFSTINVSGSKISQESAVEMIEYISQYAPEAILSPVAATTYDSRTSSSDRFDYLNFLKEAELGVNVLKLALPTLTTKPISRLVPNRTVKPTYGTPDYGSANLDWLVSNLHVLAPTHGNDHSAVAIGWQHFIPTELEIDEPQDDTNIYENKIIVGYIELLKSFFLSFIKKLDASDVDLYFEHPERVLLFQLIKRESLKSLAGAVIKAKSLLSVLVKIEEQLQVTFKMVNGESTPPIFTEKIRSNFTYRSVFERVAAWHSLGRPNWEKDQTPTGIKSIDQLYEIYCFFKVVEALKELGFEEKAIGDDDVSFDSGVCICLENKQYLIECYYEKAFLSLQRSSPEDAFIHLEQWDCRTMTRRVGTGTYSKRLPDISLVFSNKDDATRRNLVVLDAKYTSTKKAFQRYLPECVMKYVHGIGTRQPENNRIIACYLLNSGLEKGSQYPSEMHYAVDAHNLYSAVPQLPCIGTVELSPKSNLNTERYFGGLVAVATNSLP